MIIEIQINWKLVKVKSLHWYCLYFHYLNLEIDNLTTTLFYSLSSFLSFTFCVFITLTAFFFGTSLLTNFFMSLYMDNNLLNASNSFQSRGVGLYRFPVSSLVFQKRSFEVVGKILKSRPLWIFKMNTWWDAVKYERDQV